MTPASHQIDQMRSALEDVERQMVDASADSRQFAGLEQRRARMLAEINRLEFAARREAQEAERAHLAALVDQYSDSATVAAELRAAGAEIDGKIQRLAAELDALLLEGAALSRRHRAQETRSEAARSAIVKAGEPLPHAKGPGAWCCPGRESAIALWRAAHAVLGAAGLNPNSAAAQQPGQRRS